MMPRHAEMRGLCSVLERGLRGGVRVEEDGGMGRAAGGSGRGAYPAARNEGEAAVEQRLAQVVGVAHVPECEACVETSRGGGEGTRGGRVGPTDKRC